MKILITGGAGFIGGHLNEALLKRGDEVIIADNFSTGSRDNIVPVNGKLPEVYELDVAAEKDALRELVKRADVVFHLAAAVGVGYLAYEGTLMKLIKLAVTVEMPAKPADAPAPAAPPAPAK